MNCREFTDFIMAYLDGELPPAQADEFASHVNLCPPCVIYLEQYKVAVETGRRSCEDMPELPEDAPEQLIQSILAARRLGPRGPGSN